MGKRWRIVNGVSGEYCWSVTPSVQVRVSIAYLGVVCLAIDEGFRNPTQ